MNYDYKQLHNFVVNNLLTPDFIDCSKVKDQPIGSAIILPIKQRQSK